MRCVACMSSDVRPLLRQPAARHLGLDGAFELVQCRQCRMAWVSNPPDADTLKRVYDRHFFASSQQSAEFDERGELTAAGRASPIAVNSARRVARLREVDARDRVGPATEFSRPSLLDIGCGKGVFLKLAAEHFNVAGIDVSPVAARHVRELLGLDVLCGDLLTLDLSGRSFDVVTLWDVLASLTDPAAALRRIRGLLAPGGRVFLTVPDIESWCFVMARRWWPLLIPPINLFYFSRRSIECLLAQAGLRLASWTHPGKLMSTNFVLRKLGRILGIRALDHQRARVPGLSRIYLNLGDIALVQAART